MKQSHTQIWHNVDADTNEPLLVIRVTKYPSKEEVEMAFTLDECRDLVKNISEVIENIDKKEGHIQ